MNFPNKCLTLRHKNAKFWKSKREVSKNEFATKRTVGEIRTLLHTLSQFTFWPLVINPKLLFCFINSNTFYSSITWKTQEINLAKGQKFLSVWKAGLYSLMSFFFRRRLRLFRWFFYLINIHTRIKLPTDIIRKTGYFCHLSFYSQPVYPFRKIKETILCIIKWWECKLFSHQYFIRDLLSNWA